MNQTLQKVLDEVRSRYAFRDAMAMQTGKAKGWLGEYHWVSLEVKEGDEVKPKINIDTKPITWCSEQFGPAGSRWFHKVDKFYFKSEQDMLMFILRWSQ